jgi:hypothetical protein
MLERGSEAAMKSRLAYLGFLVALACGADDADDGAELKQQWLESAPQQYVARLCSTGFSARFCSVSAVAAGVPVAEQERAPGSDVWQDAEPPSDVVESIFNFATRKADEGCTLRMTRHQMYAFPSSVYESCKEEGWGLEIQCFIADTLDLSLCQQ